jgi:hypothetical protein
MDFFARNFFEGAFKAMDDELQLPFLLYNIDIFFKMSCFPPSQKFSNFTEAGNGKECVHSIRSGSLAEKSGLNSNIQNVLLYNEYNSISRI